MATENRSITKALGGAEDLLIGRIDQVTQTRNGNSYQISGIDVPVIAASTAAVSLLDPTTTTRARVYSSDRTFTDYVYSSTATTGLPSTGVGKWVVRNVNQVDTIADLQGLTGVEGQQVSVASYHDLSGLSGGGTFVYDTGRHDGGTFIDPDRTFPSDWDDETSLSEWFADSGSDVSGWRRVYSGLLDSSFYGVDTRTSTLSFEKIDSVFDGVKAVVPDGDILLDNAQINKTSLVGFSKTSSLKAAGGADTVAHFGRHTPDWSYRKVENLTIDGNSFSATGCDFNHDGDGTEELGGRWVFSEVDFKNCIIGAHHKTGNIGNRYQNCNFASNYYGLKMQNAESSVMHSGATFIEGCEFSLNSIAAIYQNDSQDGFGQMVISNSIFEGNQGFGIFIDGNNITPYTSVQLDNVWFESNHSGGDVVIDGVYYTPKDMRFDNLKPVIINDSNIESLELNNSIVIASSCTIDSSSGSLDLQLDDDSTLICDNLYSNGEVGSVPFVRSIARQAGQAQATLRFSVRGPLRTAKIPTDSATVIYQNNFSDSGPWNFGGTASVDATSVSDGVIHDTCAELTIANTYTLLGPDSGTATVGKWAVWGIHAKLVSGEISYSDLGGGTGTAFGEVYLKEGSWVCSYGYAQVSAAAGASQIRFINNSGASATIRLADMFVIEFDYEHEALEFVNSKAIPK